MTGLPASTGLNVNNPPKLLGILVALVTIGVLIAIGAMSEAAGVPIITMIVGYLVGNGVAAKNHAPVEPVLSNRADDDAAAK